MNHRRMFALASIAVSAMLAIAPSAGAAVPQDAAATPHPTAAARAAGISKAGEAHMGWSQPHTTLKSTSPSAVKPLAALALPSPAVYGIDVFSGQGNVNWASWWKAG